MKVFANQDGTGCGYWRMILPSKFFSSETEGAIGDGKTPRSTKSIIADGFKTIWTQRNHDEQSIKSLRDLRAAGLRVVYDCDDDIFEVPASNPASRSYTPRAQQCAHRIMEMADAVTVSTPVLAQRFGRRLQRQVVVIPNAVDSSTFRPFTPGTKTVVWCGSRTHRRDWEMILPAVEKFLMMNQTWNLITIGVQPGRLALNPQVHGVAWMPLADYLKVMETITADFAILPLEDNRFNRAKSNVKWLEFTAAGIPCIFPAHEPFAGLVGMESSWSRWYDAMQMMVEIGDKGGMVIAAQTRARADYEIRDVAAKWEEVLHG